MTLSKYENIYFIGIGGKQSEQAANRGKQTCFTRIHVYLP